jgi:hypothetical protein
LDGIEDLIAASSNRRSRSEVNSSSASWWLGWCRLIVISISSLLNDHCLSECSSGSLRDFVFDVVDVPLSTVSIEVVTSVGLSSVESILAATRAANLLSNGSLEENTFKSLSARSVYFLAVALTRPARNVAVAGLSDITNSELAASSTLDKANVAVIEESSRQS